jgi:hypothetical protein
MNLGIWIMSESEEIYKLTQFPSYISSNARFSKSSTHFTQIGTGGSPSE